jgi:hypothetical protein
MRKQFAIGLAAIIVIGFFLYAFKDKAITGMAVAQGLLISKLGYGSVVMIIILATIVVYYNKERIKKLMR